jgi:hypothetical protein
MGTFWTMDNSTVMKMGPAADGFLGVMPYRYYYDTEGKSPMLEKIRKMRPEYQSTGYMQGFLAAMLLTEAARRALEAGNELTGKNLKIALSSIRNFDTGGIIGVPLSIKGNSIPIGRITRPTSSSRRWCRRPTGSTSPAARHRTSAENRVHGRRRSRSRRRRRERRRRALLEVSNIEVVYNKAVQVLRGLSLACRGGRSSPCSAATGPARARR